MLGIQQLLQDDGELPNEGEGLNAWAGEVLGMFLDEGTPFAGGGRIVPQVGQNAGSELNFTLKALPSSCCVEMKSISDELSKRWQQLNTESTRIHLTCDQAHQHFVLAISPIAHGFDRPLGYFWAVIGENVETLVRGLDLAANFLSLRFHSVIAQNALQQLSRPIWLAGSTTKETAEQVAELCLQALVCSDVIVWELDTSNQMLRTLAVAGRSGPTLSVDLNVGAGLAGTCAGDNKTILIDDLLDVKQIIQSGYPAPTHPDLIVRNGWRSAMYLPLDIGGRNAGVMAAFAMRPRAFAVLDCNIALAFAQRLCASYVHIERFQQLSEMERAITIEAPAIEAGIMALERVHDADNSLLLAQNHLSDIVTRFKHDKHHPINRSAIAASGHVDSAHKSIKRLVRRAKITKPNLASHVLKPLLEAAIKEVKLHADTIGVSIRLHCPEELRVKCDKDLMHRVFMNLLHNALFFLETDRKSGERHIEINASKAGSEVELRILDNGPGIAPYDLDKVFNYFYTTKGDRGMGFGLAIVKGIITSHEGKLEVRSRWGYETEFIITLGAFS